MLFGVRALVLLAVAVPRLAYADARDDWQAFIRQWDAARVVDARMAGAAGDGRVATGCAVAAGSPTLTCPSGPFAPGDAGKVIAVYDAGRVFAPGTPQAMVQPLSTRIAAFISPTQVTLSAPAVTATTASSRVVWGTDDTVALQRALDSLATAAGTGGVLMLPPGRYLTRGLSLPCARLGTFFGVACTRTHGRIWIRGAGRDETTIENWDVNPALDGVIVLGLHADTPFHSRALGDPTVNGRLGPVAISDLELRQVRHTTRITKTMLSFASEDVWIVDTRGTGSSYECYVMAGGEAGRRWRVHYNEMTDCGNGGPAHPGGLSALNLNGMDWVASHNVITASGQGVEMGSRRGQLTDNRIAVRPGNLAVNVGSTGSGVWSNTIARNTIAGGNISVANAIGTVNRTSIVDNTLAEGSIAIRSGARRNTVIEEEGDTVVHGESLVRGNTLTYTGDARDAGIHVGFDAADGRESVVVDGNTLVCRCTSLPVMLSLSEYGAAAWRPGTAYAAGGQSPAYVAPSVDNGFVYVAVTGGRSGGVEPVFPSEPGATVVDGTVVWRHAGARPRVTVRGLRVVVPDRRLVEMPKIRVQNTERSRLLVGDPGIVADVEWVLEHGVPGGVSERVPAGTAYTDLWRHVTGAVTSGDFARGTRIVDVRPSAGREGWVAVEGGRLAPPFTVGAAYAPGEVVAPPVPNGHVYMQIAAACRAAAAPAWPEGRGETVTTGECTWRESGPAASLQPANGIALDPDVVLDPSRPLLLRTSPARNARGAPLTAPITATFGRRREPQTFEPPRLQLHACATQACTAPVPVNARATYSAWTHTASLTPVTPLRPMGWYRATIGDRSWVFRTAAPASSPRLAFGFNEGKGTTVADATGNGNAATIIGANWARNGRFGSAMSFDGTSSTIVVAPSPSLDFSAGLTVSAWVYPTSGPGNAIVLSQGGLRFGFSGGRLLLQATTSRGSVFVQSATTVRPNQWTHVAATYDPVTTVAALYINGDPEPSSGPVAGGVVGTSGEPFTVGEAPGVPFIGLVDELRIHGRAIPLVDLARDRDLAVAP